MRSQIKSKSFFKMIIRKLQIDLSLEFDLTSLLDIKSILMENVLQLELFTHQFILTK